MSFLGGAECSTAANPLAQFSKHTQDDKSLQRDRLVGRGGGGHFDSIRSQMPTTHNDKMMASFLQQPSLPQQAPQPFAMDQIRRDLPNFTSAVPRTGSPSWAAEFGSSDHIHMDAPFHPVKNAASPGFSSSEFQKFQHATGGARIASPTFNASTMNGYQRPMGMNYGMGMNGMGMMGNYRPMMNIQHQPEAVAEGKDKGRMVELDDKNWEQQFAEMDVAHQDQVDDAANTAMEEEMNGIDRSVASQTLNGDFESIWQGIEAEKPANRDLVAEFEDYSRHTGDFDPWSGFDSLGSHGGFHDPQLGDYLFEEDNIFRATQDPFNEGLKIMSEAGNLSLAALAFEAAVQRDPQHVQAWTMLGAAQAQNEKETPAIRALEQALKVDPTNLDALMGLAVSYTNEGYDATAYRTLERWLATKYPQIISPDNLSSATDVGFTDRLLLHDKVSNLFIAAAQLSPDGEHMDPDVQVGLGVLFYGAEQYDKAVDCFQSALASTETGTSNQRGQVHLLWNRLGATLANSGRSEEAIAAYERALTLNANFVRARYNLGVSCINIGCYEEAAQHLLGALSMHAVVEREGRGRVEEVLGMAAAKAGAGNVDEAQLDRLMSMNQSSNLYETLRRVFGQMGRRDLAERVVPGVDVGVFRGEFEF
ncbi:MAG: hypothetical protein LQ340_004867 [Diploschistes diacapsis]|nr:MAG: hypothetical protein LQ340_004867 [Diploschistes diacapsis]